MIVAIFAITGFCGMFFGHGHIIWVLIIDFLQALRSGTRES